MVNLTGEALRFGEKEHLTIDWNPGSAKPRHGCGSPIIPTRQTDFATTDQQQTNNRRCIEIAVATLSCQTSQVSWPHLKRCIHAKNTASTDFS
jgi:hypothetical protein